MAIPSYVAKEAANYNPVASADRSTFDMTVTLSAGETLVVSIGYRHNVAATNVTSVVLDPGGANETNLTLPTDGVDTARLDHEVAAGTYFHQEVWVLLSAPAGTFTVRVTYGATIVGGDGATAHSYSGVDSIGEVVTNDSLGSTEATITLTTTRANSKVFAGFAVRGGDTSPFTPTSGTEREDVASGGGALNDVGRWDADIDAASINAYTLSATLGNAQDDDWVGVAIELRSAVVATPRTLALMGVGG